ncbi:MAG: YIP1 family protein [Desulfomonile tiedjei]|nr:YIP1 family protein [Desulfomonile tiedjei]
MTCPHCGRELVPTEGQKFCPFCGGALNSPGAEQKGDVSPEQSAGEHLTAPEATRAQAEQAGAPERPRPVPPEREETDSLEFRREEYCPWEDQEQLGFFQGIGETLQQTLLTPRSFFARLPLSGGLLNPLLYALIVTTTGTLISLVWAFTLQNPLLSVLDLSGNGAIVAGLFALVVVFLSVVLWAVLVHVSLFLTGAANQDFEATFRVVCYASGPELFNVLPVVGGWVGLAWKIAIMIIGLREVHGISLLRAGLAVALPLLVCCGLVVATMGAVGLKLGGS